MKLTADVLGRGLGNVVLVEHSDVVVGSSRANLK